MEDTVVVERDILHFLQGCLDFTENAVLPDFLIFVRNEIF